MYSKSASTKGAYVGRDWNRFKPGERAARPVSLGLTLCCISQSWTTESSGHRLELCLLYNPDGGFQWLGSWASLCRLGFKFILSERRWMILDEF